jgi:hypothetical protein
MIQIDDDYRPNRTKLTAKEIRSTGILCGGAITCVCNELIRLRNLAESMGRRMESDGYHSDEIEEYREEYPQN